MDEDLGDCDTRLILQGGYWRVPRWILTAECHGYIIGDKSDEGKITSSRIEKGNPGYYMQIIDTEG